MEIGTVREWHDADGWGVLDSTHTPGGCWAHFSHVKQSGYRRLEAGSTVGFTFESPGQDGYDFRAVQIWPAGVEPGSTAQPNEPAAGAYRSNLTVTIDDGRMFRGDEARGFLDDVGRPDA